MPSDYLDIQSRDEARRKGVEETIDTIDVEQMKALGESLFPSMEHPWRERFFQFISENTGATFYHATTNDRIHVLYCPSKNTGMWFLPGSGMGPLQPKGLKVLKEIVEGLH
jgi:hypothetical protein